MRKILLTFIILTGFTIVKIQAQADTKLFNRIEKDTVNHIMNMDAVYNRPFLGLGNTAVSIGGYAEMNWQYIGTDGVTEGHQFQMRRMTLFISSKIGKRIKFLSEIEFEEGGKEINIEFAAIDFEFHPMVNLRGGIIMNPIGAFNQNHDGPKWEFTDRPISATQMLPATWSTPGFGLFGKTYSNEWMFGYEVYLTGNFDDSIIDNEENKTFLPAAKKNSERFEESASGKALYTAKIAVRHERIGELGVSYMGGVYNNFEDDGVVLDEERSLHVFAIDFNTTLPNLDTYIVGEWSWVNVEVPENYAPQYGNKQYGGFVDIVQPIIKKKMLGWEKASLNVAVRLEYVDWNVGTFNETGGDKGEHVWSIMPAISFRPSEQTVFRLNYRYQKQYDILGNGPAVTSGFSFGISTYF